MRDLRRKHWGVVGLLLLGLSLSGCGAWQTFGDLHMKAAGYKCIEWNAAGQCINVKQGG
jgi:hypothetical protein